MFSDSVFILLLGLTRGPGAKLWVTTYLSMASISRNGTALLRLGRTAAREENRVAPADPIHLQQGDNPGPEGCLVWANLGSSD